MVDTLLNTAWLIWVLPLLAALFIALGYITGLNRGEPGERQTVVIATVAMTGSLLMILMFDLLAVVQGAPQLLQFGEWMHTDTYAINISMLLDPFGLIMVNLVAIVNLLTLRFSVNYLHRETGFQRFFMILCLFSSAMLLIVSAGNLVLTFVGWELAGISSYLLISYSFERNTATKNATHALISNRVGDAGFLLGIFLCFNWLGDTSWLSITYSAHSITPLAASSIGLALLLAVLAKSAQLPFSGWITRALEGPTPSSAVFYGSIMVHAGVYLLIRMQPILLQVPLLLDLLLVIGLLSSAYGYLVGLVQTDIKSRLIYSTMTQIGLMLAACGLGWFDFAAIYMVLHALWRAHQFLHAPAMMHLVSRRPKPVPAWLQKRHKLYKAALERFWLDQTIESLLIKPTQAFAQDLANLDEKVVTRIVGLPDQSNAISSLDNHLAAESTVGHGRGIMGRLMEWTATHLHHFEEQLILRSGDTGAQSFIRIVGQQLNQIEKLLAQPRYLILLIVITFVVIL